ncbi:MAG: hypothetical protein QHH06_06640 [Clostridiales bacterium]|jgi:hypothetical protein|nr:hypothetical protein [Eubacteriales bacterium]MDH7566142.1 hypothetical protein [Clostridiales bacterium]
MPDRGIVFGILFVFTIAMLVAMVEMFLPISAKIEMDMDCRKTLLEMETEGGLSDAGKADLLTRLGARGMTNITVAGSSGAKQGEALNLKVEADYVYSRFTGLFSMENAVQHMVYDKTSISRRVVN